jgi:hypothetical protein
LAFPAIIIREEFLDRRSDERWRVKLGARWLGGGPLPRTLTILDVSNSGLLFETKEGLRVGSCLIVELPGDICKICKTVWSSGDFHGATFADGLNDEEIRLLIRSRSVFLPSSSEATPASTGYLQDLTSEIQDDLPIDDEEKLPVSTRLAIIVGATTGLWTLIGAGTWLALG